MIPLHYVQSSFLGGMLAEQASARSDSPIYRHSARELLNAVVGKTGSAMSRPGSMLRAVLQGSGFRLFSIGTGGSIDRVVAVGAQQLIVFNASTWQVEAELIHGGRQLQSAEPNYIPWLANELPDIDAATYHDGLIICHWKYAPAIVRRSQSGIWLCERFAIPMSPSEPAHILLHPLAIVPRAQVSATVVQTVDTTNSWKLRLRLVGSDILYIWQNYGQDPQVWDHARNPWHRYRDYKAANNDNVPPIPFAIEWLGDAPWTSPPQRFFGIVVEIHDHSTMTQSGWSRWNELVVEFPKKINGNKPNNLNAGDVISRIFEPLVGPFLPNVNVVHPLYAWPSAVAVASSRLWFATGRSRQAPHYIAASSTRSFWDWWSSNNSDDAIGLLLSADDTPIITQLAGLGSDIVVGTDLGAFVVTSSDGGAVTPKTVVPTRLTTTPIARGPRPVQVESVVALANASENVITTFSVESADGGPHEPTFKIDDISIPISGAMARIVKLASAEIPGTGGGKYLVALDENGTLWVCGISKTLQVAAWTKWRLPKIAVDLCNGSNGVLVALCRHDGNSGVWRIISFDREAWFDETVEILSANDFAFQHANAIVGVRRGDEFVGTCQLTSDGAVPQEMIDRIASADDEPPLQVGIPFEFSIILLPPSIDLPTGPIVHRGIRIRSMELEWSGHATPTVNGVPVAIRPGGEPTENPEPRVKKQWGGSGTLLRTWRKGFPDITIGREVPAPVSIHSVAIRMSVLER